MSFFNCKDPKNKILALSIAGILFSGYLSGVKLFSHTCAIDTGCSYFLGYPTCYYGFGFFALIFLVALANRFCNWGGRTMAIARIHALRTITVAGILFSLYFSTIEIARMFTEKMIYGALIMPTCFYGLIVYLAVFYFSFALRIPQHTTTPNQSTDTNEETLSRQ